MRVIKALGANVVHDTVPSDRESAGAAGGPGVDCEYRDRDAPPRERASAGAYASEAKDSVPHVLRGLSLIELEVIAKGSEK